MSCARGVAAHDLLGQELQRVDDRWDAIETVLQRRKRCTLGQQHQQPVQRFDQVRVALRLQQLQAEEREHGRFEQLN